MKNLLSTASLVLLCLLIAGPAASDDRILYSIIVEPGMTQFSFAGEDFTVVTMQRLEIGFDGITPTRVWGIIRCLEGPNIGMIKFIWTSAGNASITLHDGLLTGRQWRFDSNNVTGHNEKFE